MFLFALCLWLKYPESQYKFKENETYVPIIKNGVWKLSKNCKDFKSIANTGSDCVQLAVMMGYREIYIIGVDGYVEKINEANEVIVNGRKTLVMNENNEAIILIIFSLIIKRKEKNLIFLMRKSGMFLVELR